MSAAYRSVCRRGRGCRAFSSRHSRHHHARRRARRGRAVQRRSLARHHRGAHQRAPALSRARRRPRDALSGRRRPRRTAVGRPRRSSTASTSSRPGRRRADIKREKPELPDVIPGGSPSNPMGAAALTLSRRRIRHPRHQQSGLDRRLRVLRLHPHVQPGHHRSVRPRQRRHAGDRHPLRSREPIERLHGHQPSRRPPE